MLNLKAEKIGDQSQLEPVTSIAKINKIHWALTGLRSHSQLDPICKANLVDNDVLKRVSLKLISHVSKERLRSFTNKNED